MAWLAWGGVSDGSGGWGVDRDGGATTMGRTGCLGRRDGTATIGRAG